MRRFKCLAGDCEATCCGGWGIAVEPSEHRHLKLVAQGDAALGDLLERGIELTPEGPDYARLRFLPSGACSMHDASGLCSIHAKFGHAALFGTCATYPRYANELDGELELFGTLSCPEVARLALLSEDGFEQESVELDELPRKLRNRFDTQRPYFRPFKLVRSALLKLLAEPGYGLSEKLFVLLWVSDKLRPVLHSGCSAVPEAQLRGIFGALGEAQVLGSLAGSFRSLELDGPLPLLVLHASLPPNAEREHGAQADRFDAILREVWSKLGLVPGSAQGEAELNAVWQCYAALRAALPAATRARIETCLERYATNHVLTTPYMLAENLFEYAYDLVVRVASLRFLLCTQLASREHTPQELDQVIVETMFTFARAVEHTDLPRRLQATLTRQGLDGLAHAACFLAV
ncbi:MAG TPA: flagellin lysine-N-methylase [Polyangiaceae bacterium]|nr:flagellin lysine-N-methylase [Polyangiaceae bacterium]